MTYEFQSLNAKNNEKSLEVAKILVKAAKETHAVITKSDALSKSARESISTHNKEVMWKTLQDYISRYADFINSSSELTGIVLYKVDREFYEQLTSNDVENQLQLMIGFVYAKVALDSVVKKTYEQCVKKLLKQSGMFSDSELRQLFI